MEMGISENIQVYLKPTQFIDCDSPDVVEYAELKTKDVYSNIDKAIRLFYAVRDEIRYDPYHIILRPYAFSATYTLKRMAGFCVPKAVLLAAVARAVHIPSRLGFANVRNHFTTDRLKKKMKTDVFIFHGYTELYIASRWIKVTPTFNLSLCNKFGVKPLEFDGMNDSLFHHFDDKGNIHMEYIFDHGSYSDLPYEIFVREFMINYPDFLKDNSVSQGDFEEEASLRKY